MAIDHIIRAISRTEDGDAVLHLMPFDPKDRHQGEQRMVVLDPPAHIEAAVGTHLWGNSSTLMVGQTKWAKRIGYTRCRLIPRPQGDLVSAGGTADAS